MNPDQTRRRRRALQLAVACVVMIGAIAFAASAHASTRTEGHWCRGGDPPLLASAHTSCPFAGRVITAYVNRGHEARHWRGWVRSPVTQHWYLMDCVRIGADWAGSVTAREVGHRDVWVQFSSDI